jgi:hypothetical protein
MPATGHTKIIGDQSTGNQSLYLKLSQKQILLNLLTTDRHASAVFDPEQFALSSLPKGSDRRERVATAGRERSAFRDNPKICFYHHF